MDARTLFLMAHANVQARATKLCADMSEDQLRCCPGARLNSVAWLIWHMARCEDVMVNTVLRDEPEVLDRGLWQARLGVNTRHIGTGATHAEVERFSRQVNLASLRAYWAAVRQETHDWVTTLDFATLDQPMSPEAARRASARGAFGPGGEWVESLWSHDQQTHGWFLTWLAVDHNHSHLGEAWVIHGLLGLPNR